MNRHMYFRQQEKNELMHHGIKGQKWGIRRYQNEDGSLTPAGRDRYGLDREIIGLTANKYEYSKRGAKNFRKDMLKKFNRAETSLINEAWMDRHGINSPGDDWDEEDQKTKEQIEEMTRKEIERLDSYINKHWQGSPHFKSL